MTAAVNSASITFLTGALQGQSFALTAPVTTIGRDPANDIVIGEMEVSRRHAQLVCDDATWRIEKQHPAVNVITVNAQAMTGPTPLANGALVGLGAHTTFTFATAASVTTAPITDDASADTRLQSAPVAAPPPTPTPAPAWPASGRAITPLLTPIVTPTPPPARPAFGHTSGPHATEFAPQPGAHAGEPYIEISNGQGRSLFPLLASQTDIGRDPANDLVLADRVVSGRHLRIMREGEGEGARFTLTHPHPDRAATLNGLLYQGRVIRGNERFSKTLANGDVFRIGNYDGSFITLTYYDGSGAPQVVPPIQPIPLGEPLLSIGRGPDNHIVLPHPQVSLRHALLIQAGGTYRIVDQGSTNHVYVNGVAATDQPLALGDEVRIGPYRLVYHVTHLTQYDESSFIGIDAVDLWKTGTHSAVLLNKLSLHIAPRQFVALVGGSGAGKSTLLDALNGLRPAQAGQVFYNGVDFYQHRASFASQLGYVPQDDIVHRDLTVERALYYAAKLRLPGDFTDEQIEQRIKEALEDVEMTARRTLLVKQLSGGQRKRVSIALELLANPSVFFLDEPNSGLDPGLDRKMMFLLRKLADKGHTVVLVTHATTNIAICDAICFLAQGGRLAYFGPPAEALTYFGASDFAQIYTELEPTDEHPDTPARAEARFTQSPAYLAQIAARSHTPTSEAGSVAVAPAAREARRSHPLRQFALLTRRNLELLRNNRSNLIFLLLQAPVMALVVMTLIRVELGGGLFDQQTVVQCAPSIAQTVVTAPPSATNPTGAIQLGIDTSGSAHPGAAVDCGEIRKLLRGEPSSKASAEMVRYAQDYTRIAGKGSVATALQDFIIPGAALNTHSTIFIIGFIATLFGCINGTREIVKESSIYRRERAVNLGILPYVASKMAVLGGFALFQSAALLLVVHLFEPLRAGIFLPVLLEAFITLALTAFCGLMAGLAVSAFAANEDTANTLLPFILIPQIVFAGALFPLKDWPLQVAGMLFPLRWTMVAMGSTVGLHSDKINGDALLGSDPSFHGVLFSIYTQQDAIRRLGLGWGALLALILALTVVVCVGLRRKEARRHEKVADSWIARLRAQRQLPAATSSTRSA